MKFKHSWILILAIIFVIIIFIFTGVKISNFNWLNTRKTIRIFNCGNYIDRNTIQNFEKEYGIKVTYQTFDSNESMYTKFKLSQSSYDVIIPSDYMISRMISENLLLNLDKNLIPNFKNIDPDCLNLNFDSENQYSVPYMMGTLGILYNKSRINDKIDSFDVLFNEKFKKKIFMWDSERDAIGVTLQSLGYSINSTNKHEIDNATGKLRNQKKLVLSYGTDEIRDKMINNEADIALCYSGDAIFAMKENPNLEYIIPNSGSNRWIDSMVISKVTKNPIEAHNFINYMCRVDIAKQNSEFTGHASPITQARNHSNEFAKYLYLTDDTLKKCKIYLYLGEYWQQYYSQSWISVKLY